MKTLKYPILKLMVLIVVSTLRITSGASLSDDWPDDKFSGPYDVVVSPAGKIYLAATGFAANIYKRIYIFDERGEFGQYIDIDTAKIHPEIGFVNLSNMRLEIAPDGNLYVSAGYSKRSVVYIFRPDGELLKYWKFPFEEGNISDFDIAGDGTLYAACHLSDSKIIHFSPDGKVLKSWGGSNQLASLQAIAVGSDAVYVADWGNTNDNPGHKIHKFSLGGQFVTSWEGGSWEKGKWTGDLGTVMGMDVGPDDTLIVANMHAKGSVIKEIRHYSATGELINKWGGYGDELGRFTEPGEPSFGFDGYIYVPDSGAKSEIQVFTPLGECVWVLYGEPGDR